MVLRNQRDRSPAPGLAREVDRSTLRAAEARTLAEDRYVGDEDPGVIPQLLLGRDLFADAAEVTRFFVGSHDGVDASTATLFLDGGIAQIEDVATLIDHRGHGLARATVGAAVDAALAAGTHLVFLHADADDWPKELYAKLGFVPVGEAWGFTLPAAT
jgi:GNAT superfamily N-acetyltransferase